MKLEHTLQDMLRLTATDIIVSEVTENTVRNFLNQSSLPSVRKKNHKEIRCIIPYVKPLKQPGPDYTQNIDLKIYRYLPLNP
jgi:hypothetical protein